MQYVFPTNASPAFDHCTECGGEEHEGECGALSAVLIVTLDANGVVQYFGIRTVCDSCIEAIREL